MIRFWWHYIRCVLARRKQEPEPSNPVRVHSFDRTSPRVGLPNGIDGRWPGDWVCAHCDARVPKCDDLDPGPKDWFIAWTGTDRFVIVCSEACAQRVGAHGVRSLS